MTDSERMDNVETHNIDLAYARACGGHCADCGATPDECIAKPCPFSVSPPDDTLENRDKARADALDDIRDSDGKLPAYAWPGGYPVMYLASDNGVLCPKCANDYTADRDNGEQLKPVAYFIHYEGQPEQCENCNVLVDSAYGDPASEDESQTRGDGGTGGEL